MSTKTLAVAVFISFVLSIVRIPIHAQESCTDIPIPCNEIYAGVIYNWEGNVHVIRRNRDNRSTCINLRTVDTDDKSELLSNSFVLCSYDVVSLMEDSFVKLYDCNRHGFISLIGKTSYDIEPGNCSSDTLPIPIFGGGPNMGTAIGDTVGKLDIDSDTEIILIDPAQDTINFSTIEIYIDNPGECGSFKVYASDNFDPRVTFSEDSHYMDLKITDSLRIDPSMIALSERALSDLSRLYNKELSVQEQHVVLFNVGIECISGGELKSHATVNVIAGTSRFIDYLSESSYKQFFNDRINKYIELVDMIDGVDGIQLEECKDGSSEVTLSLTDKINVFIGAMNNEPSPWEKDLLDSLKVFRCE